MRSERRGYLTLVHAHKYLQGLYYRPFQRSGPACRVEDNWTDQSAALAAQILYVLASGHPGYFWHNSKAGNRCLRCSQLLRPMYDAQADLRSTKVKA